MLCHSAGTGKVKDQLAFMSATALWETIGRKNNMPMAANHGHEMDHSRGGCASKLVSETRTAAFGDEVQGKSSNGKEENKPGEDHERCLE